MFIDGTNNKKEWSRLRSFQFLKEVAITPKEWLEQSIATKQNEFAFAWGGMINFNFLKNIKLKFIDGIIFEDVVFGTILFAQAKNIYILPKVVYNYRIRQNSIMQSLKKGGLSEYLNYLRKDFINDSEAKNYHAVSSKIITIEKLCVFITTFNNSEISYLMRIAFFNYLRQWSLEIFNLNSDPIGFFDRVVILTHDLFVCQNKKVLYKDANSKDVFVWLSQIITLKNTFLQSKDKTITNQTTQIQNLSNAINVKTQELTSKTTQIQELNQTITNQTTQIQNLSNILNKTIKEKDNIINSNINHINQLQSNIQEKSTQLNQTQSKLSFQTKYGTAKQRIQNQLSYKLGQAMIVNSKSVLGYLIMPMALLSIIISHKQEQKIYQEKIKKDPSLKLPPLESYPDYKESLKLKNHLSYKLGQALIQANKTWYKGGYVKMWFEIGKLERKFKSK
ncbi:hypothetical protein L8Y21_07415 [Campylobacter lari]|nr:hypothetical protein [Campylobacter lari]MCV3537465.1 hypothetical protein [Campylobacter lari]